MGWRNRASSEADALVAAATEVRRLLAPGNSDLDEHGRPRHNLDEIVRNLIIAQQAASEALGEIYESCGPFFPRRDAAPVPVRETVKCDACSDYYLPISSGAGCPRCV